jgi:hypothetical protein
MIEGCRLTSQSIEAGQGWHFVMSRLKRPRSSQTLREAYDLIAEVS